MLQRKNLLHDIFEGTGRPVPDGPFPLFMCRKSTVLVSVVPSAQPRSSLPLATILRHPHVRIQPALKFGHGTISMPRNN